MANRRFELFEYGQVPVRMRQGDSDRDIARGGLRRYLLATAALDPANPAHVSRASWRSPGSSAVRRPRPVRACRRSNRFMSNSPAGSRSMSRAQQRRLKGKLFRGVRFLMNLNSERGVDVSRPP